MSASGEAEEAQLTSPPWRTETRIVVGILLIILTGVLLYSLRQLFGPLALALLLAYLLQPLVRRLTEWKIPRWAAVLIAYLVLIVLLIGATTGAGLAISQQVVGVVRELRVVSAELPNRLELMTQLTFVIGPWEIDLSELNLTPILDALVSAIQPVLSQTGALMASVLGATASTVGLMVLVLVMVYYLLKDFGSLEESFLSLVPPGYQDDFKRLVNETARVWQSFLRGQLVLGLIVGIATAVVYFAIGLRFALGLGLIAGLLEFLPIFGPIIAGAFAVLVAIFQGTNIWNLSPLGFALLVAVIAVVIQQIENNVLVPRIIGLSLNLHPLVVLLAALAGAILAGVLGVLLAAPVVATGRLCLGYVYRKAVGLDTWPGPVFESTPQIDRPRLGDRLPGLARLRKRRGKDTPDPIEADPGSQRD